MSVKDVMNKYGRHLLLNDYPMANIPAWAEIIFEEEKPSLGFCETCGPDPYTTTITYYPEDGGKKVTTSRYKTLGEILLDIMDDEEKWS